MIEPTNEVCIESLKIAKTAMRRIYPLERRKDYDSMLSQAQQAIFLALRTYTPNRGMRWHTWVYFIARREIYRGLLREAKHKSKEYRSLKERKPKPKFSLQSFARDLSEDAQKLIGIIRENSDFSATSVKEILKNFVKDLGWTLNHTRRIYKEIREAL